MDNGFHDLIRRTRDNTQGGKHRDLAEISHVILIPQQQFLNIRRDKMTEFWMGYCNLVYKGDGPYGLAEMNHRDMPVVTMMTFQFNGDNIGDDELFGDKFLAELIYAFQESMKEKLNISEQGSELICVALESEKAWQEGKSTFFQIRLQFPFCRTETTIISKIRERAITILRRRNALKELKVSPENDWDKIIDPLTHLEPLPLYKSVKANGRPRMTLSRIYDRVTDENLDKDLVHTFDLAQAFNPDAHSHVANGLIDAEIFEDVNNPNYADHLFWLPLILSIHYSSTIIVPRFEDDPRQFANIPNGINEFSPKEEPLRQAQYFLQYLSQSRAVDEFSWRDVGRALYTSSDGKDEGFETWARFTEQSDHFTRDDCEVAWATFEGQQQVTHRTIAWFAKQDSPDEYNCWHQGWCNEALEAALTLQHAPVAQYIYRLYWLDIACADGDKVWYNFTGNGWQIKKKTTFLPDRIITEVIPHLEKERSNAADEVRNITNRIEKQPLEAKIKAITELISRLNNQSFITPLIKSIAVPFHTQYERFSEYADANPSLMGCVDCVIESDERGILIRSGKPEDYLTMTTGMRLCRIKYHWGHPHVKEVMEWLCKVHTDDSLRHEFIKEVSSWLRGRNIGKRFPIWTGDKNNSKSMFIRALEIAFGSYLGKFPTSALTGRRTQSSNATPELARSRGKHVMVIQETDENTETFKKGIIKEWSGGDSIYTRGLYQDGGEFIPMFNLLTVCNRVPRFEGSDPAIKERARITPWLSTWLDEAPEDLQEQIKTRLFKKDPYFETRLPILAPALLWILTEYYPKFIKEGIREPAIVREYTREYWEKQDYYAQYKEDCLELVYADEDEVEPDKTASLTHPELFRHFKNWLLDSIPGTKLPTSMDSKEAFQRILPAFENKRWIGVRIIREGQVLNI